MFLRREGRVWERLEPKEERQGSRDAETVETLVGRRYLVASPRDPSVDRLVGEAIGMKLLEEIGHPSSRPLDVLTRLAIEVPDVDLAHRGGRKPTREQNVAAAASGVAASHCRL